MPHGSGKQLTEGGKIAVRQSMWVEWRQSPILSGRIKLVGGRADRKVGQHGGLIAPGVGAIRIDADREIQVKTDCQTEFSRSVFATVELLIGHPLQEFEKPALMLLMPPKICQRILIGVFPRVRPKPP